MKQSTFRTIFAVGVALVLLVPSFAFTAKFTYRPPGDLVAGSGRGRVDHKVYLSSMRFPVEKAPAFVNSQVWSFGGSQGPRGKGQCDKRNYNYPWRDNYCETRRWKMPLCPSGIGHQGQDIRPANCKKNKYWTVAVEAGTITYIGSYSIALQGESGIRHRYLHCKHSNLPVWVGKKVKPGDRIGLLSDNFGGTPTTIHLHYDMKSRGRYIPSYMSLVKSYEKLIGQDTPPRGNNTRAVAADGVDFDGNGKDDIFWYSPGAGKDYIWHSRGDDFSTASSKVTDSFVPVAGDFNGDGLGDIMWYRPGKATDYIWYSQGKDFRSVRITVSGPAFIPISGDFNGDGRTDIFWYGPGRKIPDYVWYSQGETFTSVKSSVSGTYRPISGDFDGDTRDDIFWYGPGVTKPDYVWYSTGSSFTSEKQSVEGTYTPVSGDFTGDGRTDIFWYGKGADADSVWISNGRSFSATKAGVWGVYKPIQGNFNGDAYDDIFWYSAGSDPDYIYYGTGSTKFELKKFEVHGKYTPIP